MSNPKPILNIPDLRMEQIFRKSLEKNAMFSKEKKITWKTVVYTVFTDVIVGQFISGFFFSFGLLISAPYIKPLMKNGQLLGMRLKGSILSMFSMYNLKRV